MVKQNSMKKASHPIILFLLLTAVPKAGYAVQTDTIPLQFTLSEAREYALENSPIIHNGTVF